jgi:MoxR-like ATPase
VHRLPLPTDRARAPYDTRPMTGDGRAQYEPRRR